MEEQQTEQPAHISYREYKKKLHKNPNEGLIIFVSAFFVLLLLFLGIAKQMSPDVDLNIGSDNDITSEQEGIKRSGVDDRLRVIQEDDNGNISSDDTFSSELDEKVKIPKITKAEEVKQAQAIDEEIILDNQKTTQVQEKPQTLSPVKPVVVQPVTAVKPVTVQNINARVVVGYYTTAEQAEVAKGIISEAGLGITPFVKNMGGAYTLQVGSFSTREKAQSVAGELLNKNFPARVIVD